jgi:hypothetical protein
MSNIMWAWVKLGVLPDRAWLTSFFSTSLQVCVLTQLGLRPGCIAKDSNPHSWAFVSLHLQHQAAQLQICSCIAQGLHQAATSLNAAHQHRQGKLHDPVPPCLPASLPH